MSTQIEHSPPHGLFDRLKIRPLEFMASANKVDSRFSQIRHIAINALGFGRDRKMTDEQQIAEAEKVLQLLTPEVIENPQFYNPKKLKGRDHLKILKLLGKIVPPVKENLNTFMQTEKHMVIMSYIQNLIGYRVRVENKVDGDLSSYETVGRNYRGDGAFKRIFADNLYLTFPSSYLEQIFSQLELPLKEQPSIMVKVPEINRKNQFKKIIDARSPTKT